MLSVKAHSSRVSPCSARSIVPGFITPCCWPLKARHTSYSAASCSAARRQSMPALHRRHTAVQPKAYLNSDGRGGGQGWASTSQLKVVVVGASPSGLAAAVGLAQQAGCVVEVHDSRTDPRADKHAENSSTLVALGKRGLDALSHLDLPQMETGGRAVASINPSNPSGSSSSSRAPDSIAGLWAPGSAGLGHLTTPAATVRQPGDMSGQDQGSSFKELNPEPLPGLTLLQGMVVVGPQGARHEEYSRPASKSKPAQGFAVPGGMTAGIAAVDQLSLTSRLLSAADALSATAATGDQVLEPQLVLPGAAAATAPKGTTPIPQGPTTAPSAEAAQEAAMPRTVAAPGTATGAPSAAEARSVAGGAGREGVAAGAADSGRVEVHYDSHLTLLDTANKQATFMCPGGQASVVSYDMLVAADASGGGHLVMSALAELQDRQAAHKHPTAAAMHHHSHTVSTGPAEMEYIAWHDMPSEPELTALLGKGASTVSSTGSLSSTPQQGWLLVWTGAPGVQQAARPGFSSTGTSASGSGSDPAIIPGAPSCTVMAWPSKGGSTWSGCVFTHPQVFEALRSQSDYERFLGSVSAPVGASGATSKLPALWITGIAAQMRRNDRVGRVPSPVSALPHSLTAPAAGLVSLSTAAVPSQSPQLLNPGTSIGLCEAAALAAHVAVGRAAAGQAGGGAKQMAVQEGLKEFGAQQGPEARALHNLSAQLSWLRHPFSPAAPAAAASVPWGSLAWIGAILGVPRLGLALQWKCLLAVLPIVAAAQRGLLYKLGLGRPDKETALGPTVPDASYRKPKAMNASTSLDSGVHVDSSGGIGQAAGQSQHRAQAAQGSSAYSLTDVSDGVEPCGRSFMSFLHTTDLPATGIWLLLQAAPLIVSVLWGALFWAAAQAIHWGMWAFRAWGWAQSGVA